MRTQACTLKYATSEHLRWKVFVCFWTEDLSPQTHPTCTRTGVGERREPPEVEIEPGVSNTATPSLNSGAGLASALPTRERRSAQGGPGRGKPSAAGRARGCQGRAEGGRGGGRAALLFPLALLLPRLAPASLESRPSRSAAGYL